jgi:fructose-1,6-bisphosphatase/inositol monophosphatase family enzyme
MQLPFRNTLAHTVANALLSAHATWKSLGTDGLTPVTKNQSGDIALKADIDCEQAVIQTLLSEGIAIRVFSEEHGIVSCADEPLFNGFLDGIDGTAKYKESIDSGRYSTMFAIYEGRDTPVYGNYIAAGILEHAAGKLYIAAKHEGAFVIDVQSGEYIPLTASQASTLVPGTSSIYIDEYWDAAKNLFSEKFKPYETEKGFFHNSSTIYYVDLVTGAADLVLDCHHQEKENLELAVAYGILREAGGCVSDTKGISIAIKPVLFNEETDYTEGFIAGGNARIVREALKKLAE